MNYAQVAWDATKDADDPTFYNSKPEHRQDLTNRANDVVKTGITNNLFEETVAKLHAADKQDAPATALGTTGLKFNAADEKDAETVAQTATKAAEKAKADEQVKLAAMAAKAKLDKK